jgi:hypothetical protein
MTQMRPVCPSYRPCAPLHVVHRVQCRHQIEVEVWPAQAEVYFRDERYIDPASTQVRFSAAVYNGASERVTWQVLDLAGNPGAGSIDAGGLYRAPPKSSLPHGTTEMVVARAVDDPLRSAYAWVALIGDGPLPQPLPRLEIAPKQVHLYYPNNGNAQAAIAAHRDNGFIDVSNKMQRFRAWLRDSPTSVVEWRVDGILRHTGSDLFFLYDLTDHGPTQGSDGVEVRVEARIVSAPAIRDAAQVILLNYTWPGILA